MTQNRFKSPIVWVSIVAIIVLILNQYGLWAIIGMDETFLTDLTNAIIGVLVMIGVLNNPTDKGDW